MGESDYLHDGHNLTTGSAFVRGFIPEMVFCTSFVFPSLLSLFYISHLLVPPMLFLQELSLGFLKEHSYFLF